MKPILDFLGAIPELLALFRQLRKRVIEAGVDRKVAADVKTINEAFEKKDAKALNDLFNSK